MSESIWDMGMGWYEATLPASDKLVSKVVSNTRWSKLRFEVPHTSKVRNFGKRYRARKWETSALVRTIDSVLLSRTPSTSGVNDVMMEARMSAFLLLR